MNKIASILVVLLALSNVVYSFWTNPDSERFFGFEINTWLYRLVWVLLGLGIAYNVFNNKKATQKED